MLMEIVIIIFFYTFVSYKNMYITWQRMFSRKKLNCTELPKFAEKTQLK